MMHSEMYRIAAFNHGEFSNNRNNYFHFYFFRLTFFFYCRHLLSVIKHLWSHVTNTEKDTFHF